MERDQACLLTKQFLVKTCQKLHELQNKYMNTCSFKLLPSGLEISGVSWENRKSREECEAQSRSKQRVQPVCHVQCKQETFPRGRKRRQGTT